ncbi:MAG TPA: RIP metalloprotease RseP, partial [Nitrospira sp.]|nr:RIP metalloprotease RseP [Nitrospira sp.]
LIFAAWLSTGYTLPVPSFKDIAPVLEAVAPDSPAAKAGLMVGDQIKKIDGRDIATRVELLDAASKGKGAPLTLEVLRDGRLQTLTVTPIPAPGQVQKGDEAGYYLGIEEIPPVVNEVVPGKPAAAAGFTEGDRVLSIDGTPIHTWTQMTALVKDNPGKTLHVDVLRDGHRVSLSVTPVGENTTVNGQQVQIGKIGIAGPDRSLMRSATPFAALYNGLEATWKWTELTVVGLYKMIVGDISSKNIGGPLTIAKISGEAAAQGPANVIFLIALLSINLGVLNLLPIPILDGGHLLFFLIEGILRKPLGERQRELAQQVGLVLLVGVMIFAFWNDLERIFFSH